MIYSNVSYAHPSGYWIYGEENGLHFIEDIFKQIFLYYDSNFPEIFSQGSYWQHSYIGLYDGLRHTSRKPLYESVIV